MVSHAVTVAASAAFLAGVLALAYFLRRKRTREERKSQTPGSQREPTNSEIKVVQHKSTRPEVSVEDEGRSTETDLQDEDEQSAYIFEQTTGLETENSTKLEDNESGSNKSGSQGFTSGDWVKVDRLSPVHEGADEKVIEDQSGEGDEGRHSSSRSESGSVDSAKFAQLESEGIDNGEIEERVPLLFDDEEEYLQNVQQSASVSVSAKSEQDLQKDEDIQKSNAAELHQGKSQKEDKSVAVLEQGYAGGDTGQFDQFLTDTHQGDEEIKTKDEGDVISSTDQKDSITEHGDEDDESLISPRDSVSTSAAESDVGTLVSIEDTQRSTTGESSVSDTYRGESSFAKVDRFKQSVESFEEVSSIIVPDDYLLPSHQSVPKSNQQEQKIIPAENTQFEEVTSPAVNEDTTSDSLQAGTPDEMNKTVEKGSSGKPSTPTFTEFSEVTNQPLETIALSQFEQVPYQSAIGNEQSFSESVSDLETISPTSAKTHCQSSKEFSQFDEEQITRKDSLEETNPVQDTSVNSQSYSFLEDAPIGVEVPQSKRGEQFSLSALGTESVLSSNYKNDGDQGHMQNSVLTEQHFSSIKQNNTEMVDSNEAVDAALGDAAKHDSHDFPFIDDHDPSEEITSATVTNEENFAEAINTVSPDPLSSPDSLQDPLESAGTVDTLKHDVKQKIESVFSTSESLDSLEDEKEEDIQSSVSSDSLDNVKSTGGGGGTYSSSEGTNHIYPEAMAAVSGSQQEQNVDVPCSHDDFAISDAGRLTNGRKLPDLVSDSLDTEETGKDEARESRNLQELMAGTGQTGEDEPEESRNVEQLMADYEEIMEQEAVTEVFTEDEIRAALLMSHNPQEQMSDRTAEVLVSLLCHRDPSLKKGILLTISRCAAFTHNQNILRQHGCLERLSRQLLLHKMSMLLGHSGASDIVQSTVSAITNLSVNEENHKELQACVPTLVDLSLDKDTGEAVCLSSLQALTNLSVTPNHHGHYTRLVQQLYDFLDRDNESVRLQALKVLINLSCNPDMVPHLLAAKAPENLYDSLSPSADEASTLRFTTLLANILRVVKERHLTSSSLPPDDKAPSPETMYSALYGMSSTTIIKTKLFLLCRHSNEDIKQNAARAYADLQ